MALDKLIRVKLIILASLQYQIAVPVTQVWWYIMGDLVLLWLGWPAGKSLRYRFASSAAALESSDLQTLALLLPTQASSFRPVFAPLQDGSSEPVACCCHGKSGWHLSHTPLPAESNPKPSRSTLSHLAQASSCVRDHRSTASYTFVTNCFLLGWTYNISYYNASFL